MLNFFKMGLIAFLGDKIGLKLLSNNDSLNQKKLDEHIDKRMIKVPRSGT